MIRLSKRLQAVAGLVTPGCVVCDVGTDHAYIPIYLIQAGITKRALAMDVNEGPLLRAKEHIAQQGLLNYITTRRSDGLAAMTGGECDSVVIAGMGGGLMIQILKEGAAKLGSVKELILQPQSDIELVRRYVAEHGFVIEEQDMVEEDGKYYMMFRCVPESECEAVLPEKNEDNVLWQLAADRYGEHLIYQSHPVLKSYLQKEERLIAQIRRSLENGKDGASAEKRLKELQERQSVIDEAKRMMKEQG